MNKSILKAGIIFLSLMFCFSTKAQVNESDTEMLWATFGISKKINKKWRVGYNQLHSYNIQDGRMNFIQPDFSASYKLSKRWQLSANYIPLFSLDGVANNQLVYHKLRVRARHYTRINKRFRMHNSFNIEHNFTQRSKFTQRYFLRNDIYYRDNSLPWRLRPFIEQRLYWYQNGRDLQYYDAIGNKLEKTAPNGLHAYRLKLGVKLYPTRRLNTSVFFLKQKEFNTSFLGSKNINSLNPKRQKIRRKFYDFSVIGVSLTYKFK